MSYVKNVPGTARLRAFLSLKLEFITHSLLRGSSNIYFHNFSQYMFTDLNKNNNEEGRRSGTTGTGFSQKYQMINKKNERRKKLIVSRKTGAHCRLVASSTKKLTITLRIREKHIPYQAKLFQAKVTNFMA